MVNFVTTKINKEQGIWVWLFGLFELFATVNFVTTNVNKEQGISFLPFELFKLFATVWLVKDIIHGKLGSHQGKYRTRYLNLTMRAILTICHGKQIYIYILLSANLITNKEGRKQGIYLFYWAKFPHSDVIDILILKDQIISLLTRLWPPKCIALIFV